MYADDLLIILDTEEKLKEVVEHIERWMKDNNFIINKEKSGIMQFRNRKAQLRKKDKDWKTKNNGNFKGYPIVEEYKYLGTILDEKLTLKKQLDHIEKKVCYLTKSLRPMLNSSSLEMAKNMWQIFILPLFEFCLPLLANENSNSNIERVKLNTRKTFRKFTFLSSRLPERVINNLMGYDITKRMTFMEEVSKIKWERRKQNLPFTDRDVPSSIRELNKKDENWCKDLPKITRTYLNLTTALCPTCEKLPISPEHLLMKHSLRIYTAETIKSMAEGSRKFEKFKQKNGLEYLCREGRMKQLEENIEKEITKVKAFLQNTG